MEQVSFRELDNFKDSVGIRFQLYNSLFISLPFHKIEKTGILLSLFLNNCEDGYRKGLSPTQIIENFFKSFEGFASVKEQTDLLLRFIQYVERQVVLFDAVEDAAFNQIRDINGPGTLKQLESRVRLEGRSSELVQKLNQFNIAIVLTAHPTQFYSNAVLGIIDDLSLALKENHSGEVNTYLQQLGKTPLSKGQKPTPYDEAASLIWYLENVFYNAVGAILSGLQESFPALQSNRNPVIKMGFWPGGDRDGNPNVTVETTIKVAQALRTSIIRSYHRDVRNLRRRLTFKGVESIVSNLEETLYAEISVPVGQSSLKVQEIEKPVQEIRRIITEEHNGLFLPLVDNLLHKIYAFGLHFASLDIRQESSVHNSVLEAIAEKEELIPRNYGSLSEKEKIDILVHAKGKADPERYEGLEKDTLLSMQMVRSIQEWNGPRGCNRYVISQCGSALNILEVYGLFLLSGWEKETLQVDIVPLFETIDDLKNAPGIMRDLYANEIYYHHLQRRNKTQTIMVGFSDGTKDGGYLMANWSIFKAKEELTMVSREAGIEVIFFDGRGGPPARGGGKTHKFYSSMGKNISSKEIQLTIQGQTVSSNFGNADSARFNMEQLLHAGISNELFSVHEKTLLPEQESVLQELADTSYAAYRKLKDDPAFLEYLSEVSPLNYYSETNISSRPSKRGSGKLRLKDLRAIPFVGAWSQLKQNVPGFYGLGTALEDLSKNGRFEEVKHLFQRSQYFKTLVENCEMAMKKSFFPLTAYLSAHPKYGYLWKQIAEEYARTEKYLLELSGRTELMYEYPVEKLSIEMRERIILPLTTIQQFALTRIREKEGDDTERAGWQRLIVRSSFGIINAGRNSV